MKSAYDIKIGCRGKWVVRPERKDRMEILARKLVNSLEYKEDLDFLELEEFKIKENEDIVVFDSDINYNQTVIFWNKNPKANNFILSYQHAGTDNVNKLCIALMLSGLYKCLVVNKLFKGVSNKKSPYNEKRTESDGCHSPVPLNLSFMDALVNNHGYGLLSMHGANPNLDYKIWFLNSLGAKGRNVNKKSIQLCLLNSAIKTFGNKFNFLTNIKRIEGEGANFPKNIIILDGPTTDVPMHIVNASGITDSPGEDRSIACHMEHDITFSVKHVEEIIKMHKDALDNFNLINQ